MQLIAIYTSFYLKTGALGAAFKVLLLLFFGMPAAATSLQMEETITRMQ